MSDYYTCTSEHYHVSDTAYIHIKAHGTDKEFHDPVQALLLDKAGFTIEKFYEGSGEWGLWPQSGYVKVDGIGVFRIKAK